MKPQKLYGHFKLSGDVLMLVYYLKNFDTAFYRLAESLLFWQILIYLLAVLSFKIQNPSQDAGDGFWESSFLRWLYKMKNENSKMNWKRASPLLRYQSFLPSLWSGNFLRLNGWLDHEIISRKETNSNWRLMLTFFRKSSTSCGLEWLELS